jgi:hypothetical protein
MGSVAQGLFKGVVAPPEASARHGEFNLLAEDHTSICKPDSKTGRRFYALSTHVESIELKTEVLCPSQDVKRNHLRLVGRLFPMRLDLSARITTLFSSCFPVWRNLLLFKILLNGTGKLTGLLRKTQELTFLLQGYTLFAVCSQSLQWPISKMAFFCL